MKEEEEERTTRQRENPLGVWGGGRGSGMHTLPTGIPSTADFLIGPGNILDSFHDALICKHQTGTSVMWSHLATSTC